MKVRKFSVNLPPLLLDEACNLSNLNKTEAIIAGLQELVAANKRKRLIKMKGKLKI